MDEFPWTSTAALPPRPGFRGAAAESLSGGMPEVFVHLTELLRYRGLVRNLVARDLKVRYRNSILGFLWCLLNPLMMMGVFTVVFTVLMRSEVRNFPVFVLVGILAWNFHATAVTGAIGSIVHNSQLVMKIYFPREVLPLSTVLSNAVNFVLALVALFGVILAFRVQLGASLVYLPVIFFTQVIFASGIALFLSALTVFFRDVEIIMEAVMLAWFFLTPIFYRMEDLAPNYYRIMYIANPMASIVSAYRDVLYLGGWPGVLAVGYAFFVHTSRRFAEEL
jgi:ABC-type polysaccharide/polyol phosphate export permease